jgi:DNA-binding transcriptional ArsR family regulator
MVETEGVYCMTYMVEVRFAPANELILSLYTFLCKANHKRIDLGPEWIKETTQKLDKSFVAELKQNEHWEDWGLLQLLVWQSPYSENVEEFLTWFIGLPIGEVYERLAMYINTFPQDMSGLKNQMCETLKKWYDQYFKHLDADLIAALRSEAEKGDILQKKMDPVEFVEYVTNGMYFEPTEGLQKIILVPQFHSQPINLVHSYQGVTICHYSIHSFPTVKEDDPPQTIFRSIRCLSDKTRLRILRFLASGPKSYTEILRHIGMAKSTVYEHLLLLRSSGLIRAHVVGSTTQSYSIRLEAIDQLNKELHRYLQ